MKIYFWKINFFGHFEMSILCNYITCIAANSTIDKLYFALNKSLAEGTYQVSVKKNGYVEQIVTVDVTNGEKSEVKVQLEKK